MVVKHNKKRNLSAEKVSPALRSALDKFVEQRSRDISLVADFGLFARPSVYDDNDITEQEVNRRVVATAYLFRRSALPVKYGIRTSVDCLRIVRGYFHQQHYLNTPIR